MVAIISWNIQCGLGVDGHVDLDRIAGVIADMADADVICLQEVSRFNADLDGGSGADQAAALADLFPNHRAIFGAALDRYEGNDGRGWQLGNMILTRLPIVQSFLHQLPQPAPAEPCKHMPRQAVEVVVRLPGGLPVRIMTTHLEFHSETQRLAQARRLRELQTDVAANRGYKGHAPSTGPYAASERPVDGILCGDFNALPDDAVYEVLTASNDELDDTFCDAWRLVHADTLHAPTCGIFDHNQWQDGPHCRDFFFIAGGIATRLESIQIQQDTNASDHQPVLLRLAV